MHVAFSLLNGLISTERRHRYLKTTVRVSSASPFTVSLTVCFFVAGPFTGHLSSSVPPFSLPALGSWSLPAYCDRLHELARLSLGFPSGESWSVRVSPYAVP